MPYTLVCFHAHPDDEALLTAGTMAKAAADGHRVVLVVATRGDVGQVAGGFLDPAESLAGRRWAELEVSARILGVARVAWLGYADSGSGTEAEPVDGATCFATAPVEEAADRLAAILVEEHADILTSYDANGGYGHRDHVQVHRVGAVAARSAGTPVLLEATIDRQLMRTGVELASSLGYEIPADFTPDSFDLWYTPAGSITHAVDVSAHLEQKKGAMQAHASQATAADPSAARTLELFLALPDDYFALAFGTEWFVEVDRPTGPVADDIFAGLVTAS